MVEKSIELIELIELIKERKERERERKNCVVAQSFQCTLDSPEVIGLSRGRGTIKLLRELA